MIELMNGKGREDHETVEELKKLVMKIIVLMECMAKWSDENISTARTQYGNGVSGQSLPGE